MQTLPIIRPPRVRTDLVRQAAFGLAMGVVSRASKSPAIVKAILLYRCRSWFSKRRGPGVVARAIEAFCFLTPEQRAVAIEHGWFPPSWLDKYSHR